MIHYSGNTSTFRILCFISAVHVANSCSYTVYNSSYRLLADSGPIRVAYAPHLVVWEATAPFLSFQPLGRLSQNIVHSVCNWASRYESIRNATNLETPAVIGSDPVADPVEVGPYFPVNRATKCRNVFPFSKEISNKIVIQVGNPLKCVIKIEFELVFDNCHEVVSIVAPGLSASISYFSVRFKFSILTRYYRNTSHLQL